MANHGSLPFGSLGSRVELGRSGREPASVEALIPVLETVFAAHLPNEWCDSNIEIARVLHLALPTVKSHVRHILAKIGAANRMPAVILARSAGLAGPEMGAL